MKSLKPFAAGLLACLLGFSAAGAPAKARKMPPVVVPCETVKTVTSAPVRLYPGHLGAYSTVRIVPRVSGYITKCYFQEGGLVKQGDLLYTIEDENYKAALDSAEARMQQQEVELDFTQKQYERYSRLLKQKATSEVTLESAYRAYMMAKAKLAEAKANLIQAKRDYGYTKIIAPISGRISDSRIGSWNYITPASGTLAVIVRFNPIYAVFTPSERDCHELFSDREDMIRNGLVRVEMANGKFYPENGVIEIIDNTVDTSTGTLKIWAVVPNAKGILVSGGIINVQLTRKTGLTYTAITPSALLTDSKGNYVFMVGKDGKAVRRDVVIGEMRNDKLLITKGLTAGDVIVADGTHKVYPGATVIPEGQQQKAAAK